VTETLPEQMHAPTSTAVAVSGGVNQGLDASDVRLPRLKFAQYMSKVVTRKLVPYSDIYVTQGAEDEEPVIVAEGTGELGKLSKPLRFYVHGEPRKGFSYTDPQNDLAISRDGSYPNLSLVKNQDPSNVRRTYDYLVTVPAYPDLPVMFLMHGKWGGQTAKQLNTRLVLAKSQGIDPSTIAFKLQTKPAEADKGPYSAAVIGIDKVAAKDKSKDQALVQQHAGLVQQPVQVVPDTEVESQTPPASAGPALD
jgi:hypothetical protein